MAKTNIGWTDYSLNFLKWFCTKTSPGCKNCYMMAMAKKYPQHAASEPIWRDDSIIERELARIPKNKRVFLNDMLDTFHEQIPTSNIQRMWEWMNSRPDLTFQVLTKRIERAQEISIHLEWPDNIWLGASVENEDYLWRLDYLIEMPAAVKFVSIEPLLTPLPGLAHYVKYLDWVIVGGESGDNRRPFDLNWAREIRDLCNDANVPFFFKQGGHRFPGRDRDLDGRTWDEYPSIQQNAPTPVFSRKSDSFPEQLSLFGGEQ